MTRTLLFITILSLVTTALALLDVAPRVEERKGQILATSTVISVRKCTHIEIPLFNTRISVTSFDRPHAGSFTSNKDREPYIINIVDPNPGTFAHEATHAMQAIVASRGIKDDETEAYLVGFITRELIKCYE